MKRIVVLMLSVLLLWTALPAAPVNAQGYSTGVYPVKGGNLYFDSGTGTVIGCDETVTAAVIPEKIAGVTVQALGNAAFMYCALLAEVSLPETVTFIDETAFANCVSLKEIVLPQTLETLGFGAFMGCTALERIEIPDSVTTMGNCVFTNCTALKEAKLSAGMTEIPHSTFSYCSALEQVLIPDSVTKICGLAFANCRGLKELYLPDNVTEIQEKAFTNVVSLEKLHLSKNLQILGDYAFDRAESLKELTLPAGITSMGDYCFRGSSIRELTVPGTVRLGKCAFSLCTELETLVLEEGIAYVPSGAFEHTYKLKELSLPSTLESVRDGAITYTSLETLIIPENVDFIDTMAFSGCEKLLSVGFLGDVVAIKRYAFMLNHSEEYRYSPNLRFYRLESAQGWESRETYLWDGVNLPVVYPDSYTVLDFTDVSRNAWYADAVEYVAEAELMNGTSATTFAPEDNMTRAMLVTVLWRYAGSPTGGENVFSDVPDGLWYSQAVAWAAEQGVVTGVGKGNFDPEGKITREQLATILFRYSKTADRDTSARTSLAHFPDAASVSSYAEDALRWAVAEGLINGIQNGSTVYLAPQGNATRAQVAAILMRYIENLTP